ncbi:MAG: HAMP domain-containing histidine kinase [Candidatus Sumerlaeaceae bacterium]|nr:HAMP domain-containing histidine kinase [Candidatus Sumerlaeaceae bacterium]
MLVANPISFACEMIEAIPESTALYLWNSDLLIPNRFWKERIGEMSRLSDISRLNVDVSALARTMMSLAPDSDIRFADIPLDLQNYRHLQVSQVPEHPDLYFFLLRDETEVRRVEQMRKDFIANVSHELRTPLTAVRGYVETLMDPKFLTIERVREFLPVIFEHTERLHNLMLDLLSLSRLENPNTVIELTPISLLEELEDAVEATAPLARMKNLTVEIRPPAEDLRVLANSEHLERVLVNLLDNAIKYSTPNAPIIISTEIEGDCIWTHVSDQGPGIAPEELPRVFERFYRTKGALSGRVQGSGLGLAISKHIIQQLGGEIRVSSTLGQGSDFFFSLRLATKAAKTLA